MKNRPYLFYELTNSVCSTCLRKVEAKIIFENANVHLTKRCARHGFEKVLISTDIAYYKESREFLKPSEMPREFNTPLRYGCPYDCGLCPDHEQHSCLTVLEITDSCNLACPVCYAESSPARTTHRSMKDIEAMLDAVVRNEGEPDIVQVSGGEPTLHPHFFEILDAAKRRPIRHLMVNTNGLRLANDRDFVKRLATYMPGFEVYLQFDSLLPGPLRALRGVDLREVRRRALDHLNEFGVSTTLVVTLQKGKNDREIGDILRFAVKEPCVRGVTFQPIQAAGRIEGYDPGTDRLTLTEVRRNIIDQWGVLTEEDVIPVPCHPDALAMAYVLKKGDEVIPLTRFFTKTDLLAGPRNTIVYEKDETLKKHLFDLFSTAHSPVSSARSLKSMLCCLPKVETPSSLSYDQVFRVIVMQFMDAHNFDVRSVKKSCVHMVCPDGRLIPFETYNLFYREGKAELLAKLRDEMALES